MTETRGTEADQPGPPGRQTTVVIPVWDDYVSERFEQAFQTVRAQRSPPLLVVVDNASTVPLPPLRGALVVRTSTRLTRGEARNLGLSRVTTPYVIFWDADDLMLEGTVSFLEAAIGADPTLAAFAMAVVEDPSGRRHRWPRRWVGRLVRSPRLFAFVQSTWSQYPSTGPTIIRTELARAVGGFSDADSCEGWCLGVSLAFRGRMGWSERPGQLYRVYPGSTWAGDSPANLARHARAVRERVRSDPSTPDWARRSRLLLWLGQHAAIAAHLALQGARELRARYSYH